MSDIYDPTDLWDHLCGGHLRALCTGQHSNGISKFVADHNLPIGFVKTLNREYPSVRVISMDAVGLRPNTDDRLLYDVSRRRGLMVLTADDDFLNDRDFPPEQGGRVLLLNARNDSVSKLRSAFYCWYEGWGRALTKNLAPGLKIKASSTRVILKGISQSSRLAYELKWQGTHLYGKELAYNVA